MPKNKQKEERKDGIMGTVLSRIDDQWKSEQLQTELGRGVQEMLLPHLPWETFCTLTTAEICSVERMRKIIYRTFELHRPLKGCSYFYCLEEFKNRLGVHAHVLVKGAPPTHKWTKTWKWYYDKYGVFQSQRMNADDHFKACAYVTKYCSKDLGEGTWGFGGDLRGTPTVIDFTGDSARSSGVREMKNETLNRSRFDLSSSGWGSEAKKKIFRKPTDLIPQGQWLWQNRGLVAGEKKKPCKVLLDREGNPPSAQD